MATVCTTSPLWPMAIHFEVGGGGGGVRGGSLNILDCGKAATSCLIFLHWPCYFTGLASKCLLQKFSHQDKTFCSIPMCSFYN